MTLLIKITYLNHFMRIEIREQISGIHLEIHTQTTQKN